MRSFDSFTFGTHCPICSERIESEGNVSGVIHEAKQEHLELEHTIAELQSYYYAKKIVELER